MKMKTKTTKNTYGKGDSCRKDSIGIAVFTDSADGSVHCCHPSISLSDSTLNPGGCSSEADMKRRGFGIRKQEPTVSETGRTISIPPHAVPATNLTCFP